MLVAHELRSQSTGDLIVLCEWNGAIGLYFVDAEVVGTALLTEIPTIPDSDRAQQAAYLGRRVLDPEDRTPFLE
jgi:hypothetical protein